MFYPVFRSFRDRQCPLRILEKLYPLYPGVPTFRPSRLDNEGDDLLSLLTPLLTDRPWDRPPVRIIQD